LLRDVVNKRGICRHTVGGCLSVAFVYCVKTAEDTATVTTECEYETVPKLSNGANSNDLE